MCAVWMKLLKRIDALPRGGERNRLTDDMLDRQCGTTTCITVKFAQDHTINRKRVMKCLGMTRIATPLIFARQS